jgi:hypothetical protein
MSHLWTGRVVALRYKLEANHRSALRTLSADGFLIQLFILVFFEPHQHRALRAGSYLRCHDVPRTLRVTLVAVTGR